MIRDEVFFYATIALLAFLAFYLMPTYERMTDGIEVDPRTKAATAPTTAVTPQVSYPSKALFGPSHISPILDHKASEEPMRPMFPPFEQFTTAEEEERKKKKESSGGHQASFKPNNVVPHTPSRNNNKPSHDNNKPSHDNNKPSHDNNKPSHDNNKPSHSKPDSKQKQSNGSSGGSNGGGKGGGGNGGGKGGNDQDESPQPYSRGDLYNLPTVTGDNTPPLSNQAPTTQTSGGLGAAPPSTQQPSNGFQQTTLPAPSSTGGSGAPYDPLNQYVLKSSLVPYTCPTGACGTPNQLPSSRTPGDMDMPDYTRMKPNQKNIGRPYGEAFSQQRDEPQPFLTDFAPFTK